MRKWIIAGVFAMFALIVTGGFFLIPPSPTETCFQSIKIGMSANEAMTILEEHKFEVSSDFTDGKCRFLNLSEQTLICIKFNDEDDRFLVLTKEIVPLESFMQRAWRNLCDSRGNDNRSVSDIPVSPSEEGGPWTLQNEVKESDM